MQSVLVGNPNCGKTALFNALTGSRQREGNWSGVTVAAKTGTLYDQQKQPHTVTDLPGIYSLSVACGEETAIDARLACQFLLSQPVDCLVNVIDASNLERNLYLTTQLLELQQPMVVAVNMLDIVEQRGIHIDLAALSQRLGCPVVGIVASQKRGIAELKTAMLAAAMQKKRPHD